MLIESHSIWHALGIDTQFIARSPDPKPDIGPKTIIFKSFTPQSFVASMASENRFTHTTGAMNLCLSSRQTTEKLEQNTHSDNDRSFAASGTYNRVQQPKCNPARRNTRETFIS